MQREILEMLAMYIQSITGQYPIAFPYWGPRSEAAHLLYTHPVSHWVRRSPANAQWATQHLEAMIDECRFRGLPLLYSIKDYYKIHTILDDLGIHNQVQPVTPFRNSSRFKHLPVIEAYRLTMLDKWLNTDVKEVSFGKRGKPEWYDSIKTKLETINKTNHEKLRETY